MALREGYIQLHQALHGYSHGHRLIESSVKIPPNSARIIQIISDMSGPVMDPGFEKYITGYPVPEMNVYALAKTWYAPEMGRPGCVWTQTLLINNADLAQIYDLAHLMQLFIRPSLERIYDHYKSPLELQPAVENSIPPHLSSKQVETGKEIIHRLYMAPSNPIYLEAETAQEFESLIFAIWGQQWPRLRRSFRFCTGSLSSRKTDGQHFDLQVVPPTLKASIRHVAPNAVFVKESFIASLPEQELNVTSKWANSCLKTAAADLRQKTQFSKFLWRFGADHAEGRLAFLPLAEIYTCATAVKGREALLEELLNLISCNFPQPKQAARLKKALFGAASPEKGLLYPEITEKSIITELVTTNHHHSLSPFALSIKERAQNLLKNDHDTTIKLTLNLLHDTLSPIGEEFLRGVCESISINDALDLARVRPSLLPLVIQNNPDLLTEPLLWQGPADLQREIFDAVVNRPGAVGKLMPKLITTLLEIGSDVLAEEVIDSVDSIIAISTILDWVDQKSRLGVSDISSRWKRVLEDNQSLVIDWLTNRPTKSTTRPATLALLASILNPHNNAVISAGSKIWLDLARKGRREIDPALVLPAMSFLLALGFNNPPPSGAELVAESFEVVHEAAMRGLSYKNWRLLQDQAPPISFWKSWDKCERLRCALIEHFIRFGWPSKYFFEALTNINTFSRTLDCADMTGRGRKYIRRLARLVEKGNIAVAHEQAQLLGKF